MPGGVGEGVPEVQPTHSSGGIVKGLSGKKGKNQGHTPNAKFDA